MTGDRVHTAFGTDRQHHTVDRLISEAEHRQAAYWARLTPDQRAAQLARKKIQRSSTKENHGH